jgi:hypothetical protein
MKFPLYKTQGVLLRVSMDIINPTRCTLTALEKAFVYSSLSNTLLTHHLINQNTSNNTIVTFSIAETLELLEKMKEERNPPLPMK